MTPDDQKRAAAERALDAVADGMILGLGTGSTAAHFVRGLGARVAGGLKIAGVPTSISTRDLALSLNIPLTTLDENPVLDLTIDGADEFDDQLRLIKGGGGALLREKIVAYASRQMVVIADQSKRVDILGSFPLPVEIIEFGAQATTRAMRTVASGVGCGGEITLRRSESGTAFKTDSGNLICDCAFGEIVDPEALAHGLDALPGVVEHGLFLDLCTTVLMGTQTEVVEIGKV